MWLCECRSRAHRCVWPRLRAGDHYRSSETSQGLQRTQENQPDTANTCWRGPTRQPTQRGVKKGYMWVGLQNRQSQEVKNLEGLLMSMWTTHARPNYLQAFMAKVDAKKRSMVRIAVCIPPKASSLWSSGHGSTKKTIKALRV